MVDQVVFEGDTETGHYIVVDTIYGGRPARVLYSGDYLAAQSGVAYDGQPDLLFDYNQRFMELVRGVRPKHLLLIGGGAFTLVAALQAEFAELVIDVVEPDVGLLTLAKTYFTFSPGKHTHVFAQPGRRYLGSTTKRYDLVIVDAFVQTTIPLSLQTVEAAYAYRKHLKPEGILAMNVIASGTGQRSTNMQRLLASLHPVFPALQVYPASRTVSLWLLQNFVVTAQATSRDLSPCFRYSALSLPQSKEQKPLYDNARLADNPSY